MFENKIYENIHYSRFVASWYNAGGPGINGWVGNKDIRIRGRRYFEAWLRGLIVNGKPIPEEVIREITEFGANGKLELQESAKAFLKDLKAE